MATLIVAWGSSSVAAAGKITPDEETFFEQRVRPLLAAKCLKCHGQKKQESGLRLDSPAGWKAGGESGERVAVAGKPGEGLLIAAVSRQGDLKMPPEEPLAKDEVETLRVWVAMGLPWPASQTAAAEKLTGEALIAHARRTHWAYQPIRNPPPPDVKDGKWAVTPVDRFVLARLEAAGLSPSAEVDRRTLIRRATFDLTGLPPTPEEVQAFVDDKSPRAYATLIDRLLASPGYGERWGRHWLDVARYADTRGYAFARERRFPYAYTYRDYVIRSLNDDKPFDRFVLEQLAADRLDLGEDKRPLAAMGYLTVGRKFNNNHDDLDDQIDVVGRGLLGLTVACARCHDHKYDAIPTDDYYSLYGVFASSEAPDSLPVIGRPGDKAAFEKFQRELDKRRQTLETFTAAKHAEVLDTSRRRVTDYLVRVISQQPEALLEKLPFLSLSKDQLKPRLVERWRNYLGQQPAEHPVFGPWVELAKLPEKEFAQRAAAVIARFAGAARGTAMGQLNPSVAQRLAADPPVSKIDVARLYGKLLEDVYARSKAEKESTDGKDAKDGGGLGKADRQLLDVLTGEGTPTNIPRDELLRFLSRADRNRQRELEKKIDEHQVRSPGAPPRAMVLVDRRRPHEPQVLMRGNPARPGKRVPRRFLGVLSKDRRDRFTDGSGRLELARAIVAKDNPLTARVIVNRVWMHHFGRPLVATPSDFGARSDPPTHPELLDHLAWSLREGGWSLKSLHRAIMLSAVYRQSSVERPDCRRADSENRLLWRMNRRRLEFEALRDSLLAVAGRLDRTMGGRPVDIAAAGNTRRTVYALVDRQDLPNLFRVFDFASPDQSSARRPETTVPQQALFLMNSQFAIAQAKALAARREVVDEPDPARRIAALYRIVFARDPTAEEIAAGRKFVASAEQILPAGNHLSAWEQYAQLLTLTNEFMFVD